MTNARGTLFIAVLLSSSAGYAQRFREFEADPGTPVRHIAKPSYDDGISSPRTTFKNRNASLPGPRSVSNDIVKQDTSIPEPSKLNNLFWSWGQFIDHDMVLIHEGNERFNIKVPIGNNRFEFLISEIPFKRSEFIETTSDRLTPREQRNSITPFVDASMVYGSTASEARNLRKNKGTSPLLEESEGGYPKMHDGVFVAGDERAGEQPGLTALHGLFVREHNRLVRMLIEEAEMTDNDAVYETARLIVGNEIQRITFNEFLPKILGQGATRTARYTLAQKQVPLIFNEFSTACFRFGHTMVTETLKSGDKNFCDLPSKSMTLREAFFKPKVSKDRGMDTILRGWMIKQAEKVDVKLVDSLRDFLFVGRTGSLVGLDLASLNIQRGRDHGLGNYCAVRQALGLSVDGLTYNGITGNNSQLSEALERQYGPDPCEMDLWVAGLAEKRKTGSILGQTCRLVIQKQFDSIFRADKFHISNMNYSAYGLDDDPVLDSQSGVRLGSVTLSDIFALNTEVKSISNDIFKTMKGSSCA